MMSFTFLPSTPNMQLCYHWSEVGMVFEIENSLFIQQYHSGILLFPVFFSYSISLGSFFITPMPMTVTSGSVSKFNCSADAEAVSFRVNGTQVNRLGNPDIESISLPGMEPRLHMLLIVANEEYNNTRVQCVAFNAVGGNAFSNETLLIIQGRGNFHIISLYL